MNALIIWSVVRESSKLGDDSCTWGDSRKRWDGKLWGVGSGWLRRQWPYWIVMIMIWWFNKPDEEKNCHLRMLLVMNTQTHTDTHIEYRTNNLKGIKVIFKTSWSIFYYLWKHICLVYCIINWKYELIII